MIENPVPSLLDKYSEAKLGLALGVSQPAIHKLKKAKRVSPHMAIRIEEFTNGAFKRWEMRPDLWDAPETEAMAS